MFTKNEEESKSEDHQGKLETSASFVKDKDISSNAAHLCKIY